MRQLFQICGTCSVIIEDQLLQLTEGDLQTIESHTMHELRAHDCVYASVQLDQQRLENSFAVPLHPSFSCSSRQPGKEAACEQMRLLIARLIQNNADALSGYELRNWIMIYQLMDVLFTHFRVERSPALERRHHRYGERIAQIASIISENYTHSFSLAELADQVHLSVPYLSKFIQEQFGMNFLTYLTQLRVNHAVHDLVNTDHTIEEISADSGFANSHSFTQAFRKEYGMMPSVYRRRQRKPDAPGIPTVEHRHYLANLRKYLKDEADPKAVSLPRKEIAVTIDTRDAGKELLHTWRNVASVGKAADLLVSDVQRMLRAMRREIGFTYLFFNGIFSDELSVCSVDGHGHVICSFVYVDIVLDFLTEIGLRPFLSFSYMPSALAKEPTRRLFGHLVSEPADLQQWRSLIRQFMLHIIERYGAKQVLTWKFTVWHQPNTPRQLFGFKTDEAFYAFYRVSMQVVKETLPGVCFGLPAVFDSDESDSPDWMRNILAWCGENDCTPDFVSFTFYDTRLSRDRNHSRDTFGFVYTMHLNERSDGMRCFVSRILKRAKEEGYAGLPVYLCEWNNTPSQQDLLNDTCFKSCYIVKNVLGNYDSLNGMAYWTLTDLMSETPLPESLLYGGLGLFAKNGLPKASYNAMWMLAKLEGRLLARGDGWFAVKNAADMRIMCYHYAHYTGLYAAGEQFIMTKTDRYTMFEDVPPLRIALALTGMEDGMYTVQEFLTGRAAGSLFDSWIRMGCPDAIDRDERRLLEAASAPGYK